MWELIFFLSGAIFGGAIIGATFICKQKMDGYPIYTPSEPELQLRIEQNGLKPCPHCGGKMNVIYYRRDKGFMNGVACSNPKCHFVLTYADYLTKEQIMENWNNK